MTTVRPTVTEHTHATHAGNTAANTPIQAKFYEPTLAKRSSTNGPPAPIASRSNQPSTASHNSSLPSLLTPDLGRPRSAQGAIQNSGAQPASLSASRSPERTRAHEAAGAIKTTSSPADAEASAKALKKFNFVKETGDPSALAALGDKPSIVSKLPLEHQKEVQAARDQIHGVSEPTPVTGSPHPSSLGPVVAPNTQSMHEDYKGEENGSVFGTKVRYLNDQERQAYKVQVKDGLVVDSKGKPFDTTQASSAFSQNKGRAIFAMDKQGNMYMSNEQTSGKFHHSSFMAGGDVAAAGDIRIEKGVVKEISRKSGHYKPSEEQLGQFQNQLLQQGVKPDFKIDKNIA